MAALNKQEDLDSKTEKVKVSHPNYITMIKEAVVELNEKNGSSRQKITKYIMTKHLASTDETKAKPYISNALKKAVTDGVLIQTSGKGASGSFKIAKSGKTNLNEIVKKQKKDDQAVKKPKASRKRANSAAGANNDIIKKKVYKRLSMGKAATSAASMTTPERKVKSKTARKPSVVSAKKSEQKKANKRRTISISARQAVPISAVKTPVSKLASKRKPLRIPDLNATFSLSGDSPLSTDDEKVNMYLKKRLGSKNKSPAKTAKPTQESASSLINEKENSDVNKQPKRLEKKVTKASANKAESPDTKSSEQSQPSIPTKSKGVKAGDLKEIIDESNKRAKNKK